MKKIVVVLVIALLLAGCTAAKSGDKWKVMTSSGFFPMEMRDEQGNLYGMDIDIMNEISKELGVEIEWIDVEFKGIIAALQANQVDMAIAGMSATPERRKTVDFSINYDIPYEGEVEEEGVLIYLVSAIGSDITSLDDLAGMIIGCQIGTIQEAKILELEAELGYTADQRNSFSLMIQEIIAGRMDAVAMTKEQAVRAINNSAGQLQYYKTNIDAVNGIDNGNGIAFPKGSELLPKVNEILQKMIDDGRLAAINKKWGEMEAPAE